MKLRAGLLAQRAALWYGDKLALTCCHGAETTRSLSFAEMNAEANRVGSGLKALGVKPGDRMGLLGYNTAEIWLTWLGCEAHHIIRAVIHSHFEMATHVWSLNQMEASAFMFDTRFTDSVNEARAKLKTVRHYIAIGPNTPSWAISYADVIAQGSPENPGLDVDENTPNFLQLTSGTTGQPKPWVKTYRSWFDTIDENLHLLDTISPDVPAVGEGDVNLHFHALQWASGFQTLYPYPIRGARSILLDDEKFDPKLVVDIMLREKVTGTMVPAALWGPILDEVEARGGIEHNLRRVILFFAIPEILTRTTQLLGPIWAHGFGSTEQSASHTRLLPSDIIDHKERLRSVGRPGSPFFELAIMDPDGHELPLGAIGEIAVRSPGALGEYWGMPERTREAYFPNNWFRPRDVGYLDEDGYLFYSDRATDAIKTEDGVVYPHQVEEIVMRHQAVAMAGVVGLGGEVATSIAVGILLRSGKTGGDAVAQEILELCQELDAYKRPTKVFFRDKLPTVLSGAKVQRSALRKQLEAL